MKSVFSEPWAILLIISFVLLMAFIITFEILFPKGGIKGWIWIILFGAFVAWLIGMILYVVDYNKKLINSQINSCGFDKRKITETFNECRVNENKSRIQYENPEEIIVEGTGEIPFVTRKTITVNRLIEEEPQEPVNVLDLKPNFIIEERPRIIDMNQNFIRRNGPVPVGNVAPVAFNI